MRSLICRFLSFCLLMSMALGCQSSPPKKATSPYQGMGSESVAPEVIEKFRAPAVPSNLSSVIQNALDIRAPGLGRVSPDGQNLFFSWNVTGVNQIWKLKKPDGFPIQMTGGEDVTALDAITPDGKFLILARDRNGEENPGLYFQSTDGGKLFPIQHRSKVQTSFQWVAPDSRYVYYRSNDIVPESYAIYRFDLILKKSEKIFDQPGIWTIADVSDKKAERVLLLEKATGSMQTEFYLFSETTKILRPILGQDEKLPYAVNFGPKLNQFFVLTSKFDGYQRLYSAELGTDGPLTRFNPIVPARKLDIEEFVIDETLEHLVYTINDQGYSRLHVLNAKTLKPISLPSFPNADQQIAGSMDRKGRFIMIGIDDGISPRKTFQYFWSNQKQVQWFTPSMPESDSKHFVRATLEAYPARDGTSIPMFVRRPKSCAKAVRPCPVLVNFHGGPEGQSQPGFSPILQIYLDRGFIVAQPNVRGSSGYGKEWLDADNRGKRLQVITDIEDAAIFIRKHWAVNQVVPKIGIMGGSYGGYSTLMGMTYFAGAFDAGAAAVGMSSLVTFLENTAAYRRILRINEYGDPVTERELLLKLSPVTYIDRIQGPMLITQGVTDPRVPAGESIQMYETMKAKGLDAELILYPDEGHGVAKRSNKVLEIGNTLRFFEKHLKESSGINH